MELTMGMSTTELDPEKQREAIDTLSDKGPLSHEQLSRELGYDWDETQKIVRRLRNDGLVSITLDRRYELEESAESALL